MIRYALKCSNDHAFDGWYASAAAFDGLVAAGHVDCPVCGTTEVATSLMAPQVRAGREAVPETAGRGALSVPQSEMERKLAALRRHVEANAEHVGPSFADRARAMHDGREPAKPIWGETRPAKARALIEDGVPVAPLPFLPTRKAN